MEEHVWECREITESWFEAFQMRWIDNGKVLLWVSFVEEHDEPASAPSRSSRKECRDSGVGSLPIMSHRLLT